MQNFTTRGLRAESLETRAMMAGDVAATIKDGVLSLVGDYRDNKLTVEQLPNGSFQITGLDGTKINGAASKNYAGYLVKDDICINLDGGKDNVTVKNLCAPDDLEITGGDGNDTITVQCVKVTDDLKIDAGKGDDIVCVTSSTVCDNLVIKTGDGKDNITLDTVDGIHLLAIHAGNDNDKISLNKVDAFYGLIFEGLGSDTVTKKKTNFTVVPGSNYIPKVAQTDVVFDSLVNVYGDIL